MSNAEKTCVRCGTKVNEWAWQARTDAACANLCQSCANYVMRYREVQQVALSNCGLCHTCGTRLEQVLGGDSELCPKCSVYQRYESHGFTWPGRLISTDYGVNCPPKGA